MSELPSSAQSDTLDLLPFADATYQADPYPYYQRVRDLTPVYESPLGVHVIARHADIFNLLRDPRLSSRQLDFGVASIFHDSVLGQDSPDHGRLRKISSSWFTPARVRDWSVMMQAYVDDALDLAAETGSLEVCDDLAFPATFGTMADILGVGKHDAALCRQATLDIGRALRPAATEADVEGANTAFMWYVDYISDLVAHKRAHPGDGLLDTFLEAEATGLMATAEVVATTTLFYAVGHLDNSFMIENGIRLLLDRRAIAQAFVAEPDLREQIIAEILRIDTPEQFVTRYVTEDIDVDGTILPAGAVAILLIGSGNMDERVFAQPDEFDITRPNVTRKHLAFSGGQHGCAGQVLARAQGEVALGSFFSRFPAAHLDGVVEVDNTEFIRGIRRLPVAIR
ncbi:MAG: cytochrome P450 [Actinomycetes bacterium]